MSAFLSSPDDDDINITLLLLAICNPSVNKTPFFSERLTIAEVRRRSGKIWHYAAKTSIVKSILYFVCSTASMMTLSSHCVGLTMLHSSSYTSCLSLVLIPLIPEKTDLIVWNSTTKNGQRKHLCSISCLALELAWTRNRGSYKFARCPMHLGSLFWPN